MKLVLEDSKEERSSTLNAPPNLVAVLLATKLSEIFMELSLVTESAPPFDAALSRREETLLSYFKQKLKGVPMNSVLETMTEPLR